MQRDKKELMRLWRSLVGFCDRADEDFGVEDNVISDIAAAAEILQDMILQLPVQPYYPRGD